MPLGYLGTRTSAKNQGSPLVMVFLLDPLRVKRITVEWVRNGDKNETFLPMRDPS